MHLIATEFNLAPIGSVALDLLDAHRSDIARRWLDRARESIKESQINSFKNHGFARLWPPGNNASDDELRIAAAALAAMDRATSREIDILRSAYTAANGEHREALGSALAVGYVSASRLREAAPLLEEGLQSDRNWNEALETLVNSRMELGEFDAAERAIATADHGAADHGGVDAQALRLRARVAFARRDVGKAHELLGQLVDSGGASNEDRNLLGWVAVAEAAPDTKALEIQRDLVASLGGRAYAASHTLACVYAINGRGPEARDALRWFVSSFGGTIGTAQVALIQGLLAESYGERELARRFFEQASKDPEDQSPLGSGFIAKLRLEMLDKPTGARKAENR